MTHQGPDLYVSLRVPAGDFTLSLYDFNKDGHAGNNRLRDYRFSLRPHPSELPLESIEGFESWPELANGRIRDFWGGVYKRFLVRGPQTLTVQVGRNYSFNTILAGVFLDKVSEEPEPYFAPAPITLAGYRRARRAQRAQSQLAANAPRGEAVTVDLIWAELERIERENPRWWATQGRLVYGRLLPWLDHARLATSSDRMPQLYARLGTCYYQLAMFGPWEAMQKRRGLTTAREIERGLVWDGHSDSSGAGRAAVMRAVAERKQAARPVAAQTAPANGVKVAG